MRLAALSRHVVLAIGLVAPLAAQQSNRFGGAVSNRTMDSLDIERLVDSLPLSARAAQVVMPWVGGGYAAFDDSVFTVVQRWVDSVGVGGILISIGSPSDIALKLNRLQQRSGLPLLVGADLESGSAFRLNGGTPFPSNMGVAATGREDDAYDVGRITALEGRAVGIHLTFAPDADVNNNPANPIINTRSFGEDPWQVARLVDASIRGLQDNGMLSTAKHFPGHGDTGTDSHLALPVIRAPWTRLDTLELVPFRAAIKAGVAMVMSAHIALPGVGTNGSRPATLDPAILTGVLRDSLHFNGVVVTDALDMGGVVNTYGAGEAAVMAFEAGADLLLQPTDPAIAVDALVAAVESGRISYERLDRSVRRLLQLKRHLGLFNQRTVNLDSIPAVVGSSRFLATARQIAERSVVLVADSEGTVDSLRASPRSIALITYGEENAGSVGGTLARELRLRGHRVFPFRLWPASGPASLDSVRVLIRRLRYVVFAASVKATSGKGTLGLPDPVAALIDESARRRRVVLVSLGSPYLASQVPHLRSYLLGWTANSVSEWAVAQALSGAARITGHLPVRIPPAYQLGDGLLRTDSLGTR